MLHSLVSYQIPFMLEVVEVAILSAPILQIFDTLSSLKSEYGPSKYFGVLQMFGRKCLAKVKI